MSENYDENYHLVYNITWLSHGKVEIYRDIGVPKNVQYDVCEKC